MSNSVSVYCLVIFTKSKNPAVYRGNLNVLYCSWQFTADSFPLCASEDLC